MAQYPTQQQNYNDIWNSERFKRYLAQVMAQNPNVNSNGWTALNPGVQTNPYQIPASTTPYNSGPSTMANPSLAGNYPNQASDINPAGPRPRPRPNLTKEQVRALKPGSMGRPPQSAFGQQNPTIFNQNFANTPYGQRQMQQPYRPIQANQPNQRQFRSTVW